ncbi:MAG: 2-amino-4-hydroxy-6-hydroxymethyldihydropteridine diphosphokinase [Gammaproteobacteria bacterium]
MDTAYIGLGSNLDNPRQHIIDALHELAVLATTRVVTHSALYVSKPVGPVSQPDYVNAVASLQTILSARQLLDCLLEIEGRHGRIRDSIRWGPRTLDLDLLLYGDVQTRDETLVLPHPRLQERNFVLIPLYEIAPQLVIPGQGALCDLVACCPADGLARLETI